MLFTKLVWNRDDASADEMGTAQYNLIIGFVLLWGLAFNWYTVNEIGLSPLEGFSDVQLFFGYVGCVAAGTLFYTYLDHAVYSFVGYNLIVLPLGLFILRFMPWIEPEIVGHAFQATSSVVVLVSATASLSPKYGARFLFALLAGLMVQWGFVLFEGWSVGVFDCVFLSLFCGYIGFDWAKAQQLTKTWDNAVDAAAAIYMDVIITVVGFVVLVVVGVLAALGATDKD
jgi:hypothetical protein